MAQTTFSNGRGIAPKGSGGKRIVIQCGASTTPAHAGKIFICGSSRLVRASGVNRTQGGSVQVN